MEKMVVGIEQGNLNYRRETIANTINSNNGLVLDTVLGNKYFSGVIASQYGESYRRHALNKNLKNDNPGVYENFMHNMEVAWDKNERSIKEMEPHLRESFLRKFNGLIGILKIDLDEKTINERIKNTHVFALDIYHFMCMFLSRDGGEDSINTLGHYKPSINTVSINISGVLDRIAGIEKKISSIVFDELLFHIYSHEMLHAISVSNFWKIKSDEGFSAMDRRRGLSTTPLRYGEKGRLRELNEAVTEKLNIMLGEYKQDVPEDIRKFISNSFGYRDYIKILDGICEKVPFEEFVKAYFDKDYLLDLNRVVHDKLGIGLKELGDRFK